MTTDVESLYGDVVRDHCKRPRNFRALETGHRAEASNPVCGDRVTVYLDLEGGRIRDAAFQGFGCAIAIASASLMTEGVKGRLLADALALGDDFERMIAAPADKPAEAAPGDLGQLSALAGVRRFPVRAKCARLPWAALRAAVAAHGAIVSTE
jgi:nitrogen fixation NifU-like protein